MRVFLAIAWLSNGVNGDFQEMGTGAALASFYPTKMDGSV